MALRVAAPPPLRFDQAGTPDCPLCALLTLPEPLAVHLNGSPALPPGAPPATRQALLTAYHEGGHLPAASAEGAGAVVAKLLASYTYAYGTEKQLAAFLAGVLGMHGLHPEVEHRLSKTERIDVFLPHHGIGVEVKIAGGDRFGLALAQLDRYSRCARVAGLVLVTSNLEHGPTRALAMGAFRVHVVQLGALAL